VSRLPSIRHWPIEASHCKIQEILPDILSTSPD
jgi:hypothetical protein